jgi:hypothetical protein
MTTPKTPVRSYVDAIRNDHKRDYARAYLLWLQCGAQDEAPDRRDYAPLSVMGAQAIRMRIQDLMVGLS